ncbi:MAG: hypothetical protein FJZ95_05205 [Chloroflexi bacterium]|nr:hypothetical protein [Chloroflexota bacterium]
MSELPPLVRALLRGDSYPEKPRRIDLMQTQMSFVFLTGEHVYKIKKPLNFGFADFTSLEKRRFYCGREVELNRRLSPSVYLGVVEIREENGRFSIEGEGKTVEYAVKMRQLPMERSLNRLLDRNQVIPEMVERVARKLAEFHAGSRSDGEIAGYGSTAVIRQNTEENFAQTEKYTNRTLSRDTFEFIKSYTHGFLERETALFDRRVKMGRIRDCHGDLHSEHVVFGDDIYIFDCIEFNDRFRYCDVASEIAFLAMDIDFHGRSGLSDRFVEAYMEFSGDSELLTLLDFYKCYLAYVRGKVESFELDDPSIPEVEKMVALDSAKSYFWLAKRYATG